MVNKDNVKKEEDGSKTEESKQKCVCEICTCGDHRCPHNQNQSKIDHGSSSSQQQQGEAPHLQVSVSQSTQSGEQYRALSRGEGTRSQATVHFESEAGSSHQQGEKQERLQTNQTQYIQGGSQVQKIESESGNFNQNLNTSLTHGASSNFMSLNQNQSQQGQSISSQLQSGGQDEGNGMRVRLRGSKLETVSDNQAQSFLSSQSQQSDMPMGHNINTLSTAKTLGPIRTVSGQPQGPTKVLRGGKWILESDQGNINTSTSSLGDNKLSFLSRTERLLDQHGNILSSRTVVGSQGGSDINLNQMSSDRNLNDSSIEQILDQDGNILSTRTVSRDTLLPVISQYAPSSSTRKIIRGGKLETIPGMSSPCFVSSDSNLSNQRSHQFASQSNFGATPVSPVSVDRIIDERGNVISTRMMDEGQGLPFIQSISNDMTDYSQGQGSSMSDHRSSQNIISESNFGNISPLTGQILIDDVTRGDRVVIRSGRLERIHGDTLGPIPAAGVTSVKPTKTIGQSTVHDTQIIFDESQDNSDIRRDSSVILRGGKLEHIHGDKRYRPAAGVLTGKAQKMVLGHDWVIFKEDHSVDTIDTISNVTDDSNYEIVTSSVVHGPVLRGSRIETVTGGKIHQRGDHQGMTIVTQSKTSMDQTADQRKAQQELQDLTTATTVYGVHIDATLRDSKVKAVHEREISTGTVKLDNSEIVTTENIEKSITEVKSTKVTSDSTQETVDVDEKITSSIRSSDRHTFRLDDVMNRSGSGLEGTTMDISKYGSPTKTNKIKTGQMFVEDNYGVQTSFESRDSRANVKSRAIQDENFTTTTFLEKVEDRPHLSPIPTQPKLMAIRQPDQLKLEGQTDYTTTNKQEFDQKTTILEKGQRRQSMTRPEGDMTFQTTAESEFTQKTGERPKIRKQRSWAKQEGEMFLQTTNKREYKEFPMTKQEVKKYEDNLRLEQGSFNARSRTQEDYEGVSGVKSVASKPVNNLYPEGKFYEGPKPEAPLRGERADVVKPINNLKIGEGEFYSRPKQDILIGERRQLIKQADNLHTEGKFYSKPKEEIPVAIVVAERRKPYKQQDNLHSEGEFYSKPKEDAPVGERRQLIKQDDNLHVETGQFYTPIVPEALRGERAEIKKPVDNLYLSDADFTQRTATPEVYVKAERYEMQRPQNNLQIEGDFYRKPKEEPPTIERRGLIKHDDNLHVETGQFYSPTPEAPVRGERADIVKPTDNLKTSDAEFTKRVKEQGGSPMKAERFDMKRPLGNLKSEGEFYVKEKEQFVGGEKREAVRQKDNLIIEGEFYQKPKESVLVGERRQLIKQDDNLYPEGEFYQKPKEQILVGERRKPYKRDDHLHPEGSFQDKIREEAPKGERVKPCKMIDNLFLEGEFHDRPTPKESGVILRGDRAERVVHKDNIQFTGEFEQTTTSREDYQQGIGERHDVRKEPDHLHMEGVFESRTSNGEDYRNFVGERVNFKRPRDNLVTGEGQFYDRPKETAPLRGDRAPMKIPHDNLYTEGQFYISPPRQAPQKGERADIKKPVDNLKASDATFTQRQKEAGPMKGERYETKKPVDSLRPEGDFYGREKQEAPTIERRALIKHGDNLQTSHEEFYQRPKEQIPVGERFDAKKPIDNLRSEGDFYQRPKEQIPVAERRKPYKQDDNLYLEGQFYVPTPEAPLRGEKAEAVRPKNNLTTVEGDFVKREVHEGPIKGERYDVKIPQDNLKQSGEFYGIKERDQSRIVQSLVERRAPIRQDDNLEIGGDFYGKIRQEEWKQGERFEPQRPIDNLRTGEGDFAKRVKDQVYVKGERYDVQRPQDNLRSEGDFYQKPKEEPISSERRQLIKQSDNLRMEGDFYQREKQEIIMGERRQLCKTADNLYLDGEFYDSRPKEPVVVRGERADRVVHKDNITFNQESEPPSRDSLDMELEYRTISGEDYKKFPVSARTPIKPPRDNLYPEGTFYTPPKSPGVGKGERYSIKKPVDSEIWPSGEFTQKPKQEAPVGERRRPYKQDDNLHPEGEFYGTPNRMPVGKGDRAQVVKPKDTLRPEGEFSPRHRPEAPKGERRTALRQSDNLHPEGEFYAKPKEEAPTRGDRADIQRPVDNLRPNEGQFSPRERQPVPVCERRTPVKKPEDNLDCKGEFAQRSREIVYVPGERADKIVHPDELRLEGSMTNVTTSKQDFAPQIGERTERIRHEDNLIVGLGSADLADSPFQKVVIVRRPATTAITVDTGSADSQSKLIRKQQRSSQIVLGDELGDARFDRTTTARRTTVEVKNLQNIGQMTSEKSLESSVRLSAETNRNLLGRPDVERKIMGEAMSGRSTINQSIVLNNTHDTSSRSSSAPAITSGQHGAGTMVLYQAGGGGGGEAGGFDGQGVQIHANHVGSREVNVSREITLTKRPDSVEMMSWGDSSGFQQNRLHGQSSSIHQQLQTIGSHQGTSGIINNQMIQGGSGGTSSHFIQGRGQINNQMVQGGRGEINSANSASEMIIQGGSGLNSANNSHMMQRGSSNSANYDNQMRQGSEGAGSINNSQIIQGNGGAGQLTSQGRGQISSQMIQGGRGGKVNSANYDNQMRQGSGGAGSINNSQIIQGSGGGGSQLTSQGRGQMIQGGRGAEIKSANNNQIIQGSGGVNNQTTHGAVNSVSQMRMQGEGGGAYIINDQTIQGGGGLNTVNNSQMIIQGGGGGLNSNNNSEMMQRGPANSANLSSSRLGDTTVRSRSTSVQGRTTGGGQVDNRSSRDEGGRNTLYNVNARTNTIGQNQNEFDHSNINSRITSGSNARNQNSAFGFQSPQRSRQSNQQQQQQQSSQGQHQSLRSSRMGRNDNLIVGQGNFDGQTTSSNSYGRGGVTERVAPIRSTHKSSISLGNYSPLSELSPTSSTGGGNNRNEEMRSSECPATLLETQKSPFKYQRQTSSHRFYTPDLPA